MSEILYSLSQFSITDVEKSYRPEQAVEFARNNYIIPITLVTLYLLGCYYGKIYMQDKKPYDLRLLLAGWNALLSLFSFIGMCRTVPYLLANIMTKTYEETICAIPNNDWGSGACGFWVTLFIISKVPELIDTMFIVLRKKPLIFLHWYHHVTVLLFCWSSFATTSGSGLYFVAMNYTVHALMYGYYCLQALNICPKWFPTVLITISQITQMFIGTAVCMSAWYFTLSTTTNNTNNTNNNKVCANEFSNLIAGAVMYGSYLYLFVEFAVGRYGKAGKAKGKWVKLL